LLEFGLAPDESRDDARKANGGCHSSSSANGPS
jgi:hypothetical protein